MRVPESHGWGVTQYLAMLIGHVRARYLSFIGNYLDADTAKAWGFVLEVLPPNELLPYCRKVAGYFKLRWQDN